ncbi:hypothetical protein Pyn_27859 [Prunus yedoensis var. nudiflora]|uniref:Uncharacterized protein n=1 Tax=Prunus yedoensis var. nudiflora TaxID=2094558 RepID=A0A314ZIU5_PRUYE|nr:hypothetical protein Pyn_27859 [Prunus yedoensis var. nudiflora]
MDLPNSFGGRTSVPEEDDIKKIIAPLRTEKILASKIERLLSTASGIPLVRDERIRGLFQMKCSTLRDKCKCYGFPRLAVACWKLLRANKISDNIFDELDAVKNEFFVLANSLRPALGTIEFLHEMIDMVVTDFGHFYDINTLNLDGRKKKNTTAPTSAQKIPFCSHVHLVLNHISFLSRPYVFCKLEVLNSAKEVNDSLTYLWPMLSKFTFGNKIIYMSTHNILSSQGKTNKSLVML